MSTLSWPGLGLAAQPAPGALWGAYPQRPNGNRRDWLDALHDQLRALDGRRSRRFAQAILDRSDALQREFGACSLTGDRGSVRTFRRGSRAGRIEALALACIAARRTLDMSPYPTQVQAAAVMLDGGLAELATGEGKTLAMALAAAARAMAGTPVHVISVNDYLVERDAGELAPFYAALGLSCDRVLQSDDAARRRQAWRADVTYCTGREVMFDYLRDRLAGIEQGGLAARASALAAGAQPQLRGLSCAFIDEADSILIDEATLPCILALPAVRKSDQIAAQAIRLAEQLWQGRDFTLERAAARITLTEPGRLRVTQAAQGLSGDWSLARVRDDRIGQALSALHLYLRDRDYLVHEDRIEIIDRHTGRMAPGRSWSRGLHQMIEFKEGVAATAPHQTTRSVCAQQFFPRYWRLGGLSATLRDARGELAATYGLSVTHVAPRHRSRRIDHGISLQPDCARLHAALVERARALLVEGRPVLIGTRDVAESEELAGLMRKAGLAPAVLNARHDREEANIVALAGRSGSLTIATCMAGRGTDIALDDAARVAGGLALLTTSLQASRRLDRQLHGRSARRGEPGSVETLVVLSAPVAGMAALPRPLAHRLPSSVVRRFAPWLLRAIQRGDERRCHRERRRLRLQDEERERLHVIGHIDE
jgi:preprotein translocase subunit SecA